MSTRWYPIYQKGGPQLRVFLPNFWMKLVSPTMEQPPNVVQFECSMEMTRYDMRNYLEKIYNIKPINIRTRIALGETRKCPVGGYIVKDDDKKLAFVVLHKDEVFEFPELHPKDTELQDQYENSLKATRDGYKSYLDKNKGRPGLPGWFSF